MYTKVVRSNALVLSYDMLSDEGKVLKKNQKFNILAEDFDAEEIYEVGSTIGTILTSAVRETRQDLSFIIVEG